MDAQLFKELTKKISDGKHLPDAIYLHKDAFSVLPSKLSEFIPAVAKALKIEDNHWHLVKIFKKEFRLSLLCYPDFYSDSYPSLKQSVNVDLSKLSHKVMDYTKSENPPILHRKETMVLSDSSYIDEFQNITAEGEAAAYMKIQGLLALNAHGKTLLIKKVMILLMGVYLEAQPFSH